MVHPFRHTGVTLAPIFTAFAVASAPGHVFAAWLGFRNDTTRPVVVQTISAGQGNRALKAGKPQQLYPGEVAWDSVIQPGKRSILVLDARQPNVLLGRREITVNADDQFFSLLRGPGVAVRIIPTSRPRKGPPSP